MVDLTPNYVLGVLDSGAHIYLDKRRPRLSRVELRTEDHELMERLRTKFGGRIFKSHWRLTGGQQVEVFLRTWAEGTRRADVEPALAHMTAPNKTDRRELDAEDTIEAFIRKTGGEVRFADVQRLLPDLGSWTLRRILQDMRHAGRLERLPSIVIPGGQGTTGHRYRRPRGISLDSPAASG